MDQPLQRDNVRIDGDTGAVDGRGKFSRAAVPRGTRFTFEVSLASDVSVNPDWSDLLSVIANGFRIGGATRRGLGRVCVKTVSSQTFELDKDDQYQAYCNYQRDPAAVAAASKDISSTIARSPTGAHILELQVKAVDYVRIGQSKEPLALGHAARPPHQIPRHETVIVWSKSQGATLQELRVVVPGSSIKGALRHRVQFHLNCLNGSFADHAPADRMPDEPSLKSVFGFVADRSRGENGKAQAGIISIDDVFLDKDPIIGLMMHNSLDRFSQGTRDGVLFSEELLFETPLSLCIEISAAAQIDPKVREALRLALDDFSEGRLAIGGGAAKGHGYFKKNVALRDHTKSRSWTQFFGGCS
ncbi:MAG: hypothetical protein HOO99_05290 [Hyphomicrobiaceae bacterium]|nr:hypothetical protein [Hyphomicrobiaceae bacterium]